MGMIFTTFSNPAKGNLVKWIVCDVTQFKPHEKYDLWHDRAAFHFLITDEAVQSYVDIATNCIANGGILILSTFSENGPKKCSNLDVRQYSEESMTSTLGPSFKRIECDAENHITPFNTTQNFTYCYFARV